MPRKPQQFDLFKPPKPPAEQPQSPPDDEGLLTPPDEELYHPTDEDEQARLEMEHGPGARYIPPKSREEREAEQRQRKRMMDDALGRMGAGGGRQLLTDAESPFARGQREEDERRKRKKGR